MRLCFCCGKLNCNHNNGTRHKLNTMRSIMPPTEEIYGEVIDPQLILNAVDRSDISISPLDQSIAKKLNPSNTDIKKMINNEPYSEIKFITCSFCKRGVHPRHLNSHLLEHISPRFMCDKPEQQERVRVITVSEPLVVCETSKPFNNKPKIEKSMEEISAFFNKLPNPKLRDIEEFSFREILDVSCVSFNSQGRRYSDFTLVVWFKPIGEMYNATYTGHHTSHIAKLSERLNIHFVYDSLEDYFTMSAKILKYSAYSSWDTEDARIPERVIEQKDIMQEVRRMLLFFCVPPTAVLKRLLKCLKKGITSETDDKGLSTTYSTNHTDLYAKISKAKEKDKYDYDDEYACFG